MKKWFAFVLAITLLFSVSGFAAAEETAVTLTPANDSILLSVDAATTVKVTVAPYAARKKGVTYATSDESVATITAKGRLTGVAEGQCTVTVTSVYDPTVSITIPVSVIIPVKKVVISSETKNVYVGQTLPLTITYTPDNATMQSVTYTSDRDTIATVSEDGVVTGVQRGATYIKVVSADGKAKASYKINVLQAPESVTISPETASAAVGRKVTLKATVSPTNTNDKTILWTSSDESIATVSSKGVVTLTGRGTATITATCEDAPSVSASVPVSGVQLATSVAFAQSAYSVIIGETVQLTPVVLPDDTSDPSVTYKVKTAKIASIDENGLLTGLKGGKTTVYVYSADGSKKRGSTTVEVLVPVTGVSYKYHDVRVGKGNRKTFTATITPSDASDKKMTWVTSDDGIASVYGTTNRFTVKGHRWGRCTITGTTEDGGYTVTLYVNVGTLADAISVKTVSIVDGKPSLKLTNVSNMNITQIRYRMVGYDQSLQPIKMSTTSTPYVLEGTYDHDLGLSESTRHGSFTFVKKSNFTNLAVLQFCITGWSTDTGFYDANGQLRYEYSIAKDNWNWVTYPDGTNVLPQY